MFKKVVALLMAAAMTVSMATLSTGEVKAAGKNHAAEYNVDFQREAEESGIRFDFGVYLSTEWVKYKGSIYVVESQNRFLLRKGLRSSKESINHKG